jgi:hypothetical protein
MILFVPIAQKECQINLGSFELDLSLTLQTNEVANIVTSQTCFPLCICVLQHFNIVFKIKC